MSLLVCGCVCVWELTWNAGAKGDENYGGDGVFDTHGGTEMWGDVSNYGSDDSNAEDWDHETEVAFHDIWNVLESFSWLDVWLNSKLFLINRENLVFPKTR